MDVLREGWMWFADSTNWSGPAGVPVRIWEHVLMSALATGLGAMVALPVGMAIGHTRRGDFVVTSTGNIGRALPSFGVLALVFPFTFDLPGALGFWPTLVALFLLSIPPMLTNTNVGIREVDPAAIEAARGMGMTGMQVLRRVELPLAAPLIVAGIRTAAVQVVATATLAAFVAWGGLGRFIVDGFAAGDDGQKIAGAVLVALLAMVTEVGFGLVERTVTPRGTRFRDDEQIGRIRARLVGAPRSS